MESPKPFAATAPLLLSITMLILGACGSSSPGSSGTSDAGTGCSALAACCPKLPVSENPTECATVATTGTTEACSISLMQYQTDGYCEPSAASQFVACYIPDEECIWYPADHGCPDNAGTTQVAACPAAADFYGCCVYDPATPHLTLCYYGTDADVIASSKEECTSGNYTWTTTLPGS